MKQQLVILVGLLATTSLAQVLFGSLQDDLTSTQKPWHGPFADHVVGVQPHETPEVAAAKLAHNEAHAQILSILPILPPEERYIEKPVLQPQTFSLPPLLPTPLVRQVPQQQQVFENPPVETPSFQTFANEIPRSSLGEVPEVHAARQAHLKAYQEALAALPPLTETPVQSIYNPVYLWQSTTTQQPLVNYLYNHQVVQDTPEVAKAKAEHAAAVAAALG